MSKSVFKARYSGGGIKYIWGVSVDAKCLWGFRFHVDLITKKHALEGGGYAGRNFVHIPMETNYFVLYYIHMYRVPHCPQTP